MALRLRRIIIFAVAATCSIFLLFNLAERRRTVPVPTILDPEAKPATTTPFPKFDLQNLPPFKWRDLPEQHPVDPASMIPLPTNEPATAIPQIQHDFRPTSESTSHRKERQRRLSAIKEAFTHSWTGYKKNAWTHDEVMPISGKPSDPFGGWGATLVDTLDTLWIMGMEKEFAEAVAALDKIDFSKAAVKEVNVFETTIRYLGGFLAAYDLSEGQYPLLLQKAEEVAEMLYKVFDTPNRMPITRWDWQKYLLQTPQQAPASVVVAEIGSLTLEFTRLSQLTGNPKWYDAVQRVMDVFAEQQSKTRIPGLWPLAVNPLKLNFHSDTHFTIGGMADSVFEYLSKEFLLLVGRSDEYASMHNSMVQATKSILLFEPLLPPTTSTTAATKGLSPLFLGTIQQYAGGGQTHDPDGQHLTCFAGGMFALGARALRSSLDPDIYSEDMGVARRLTDGCIWSYLSTPTGIGPEIFRTLPCRLGRDAVTSGRETDAHGNFGNCTWDEDKWLSGLLKVPRINDKEPNGRKQWVHDHSLQAGFTHIQEPKYILRPEAIESVFILYRTTGDEALRDYAWQMFQAITRFTRTDVAFASLVDVMTTPVLETEDEMGRLVVNEGVMQKDNMESFWTAETLKYFYLTFEDEDVVSLDEWVLNTEAHPFRWRQGSGRSRGGMVENVS